MTEVHHLYGQLDTDVSNEVPAYRNRLTVSGFQANGTYVIFASCKYRGQITAGRRSMVRLSVDGVSRTVTRGMAAHPTSRNKKWQTVYVHTFGDSPGTADMMFANEFGSAVKKYDMQIMAFRLDDHLVEGKDWKFGEGLDDTYTAVTSSWQDAVSVTFQGDSTADWLVFGSGHNRVVSSSTNEHAIQSRMTLDGATSGDNATPLTSQLRSNFGWGETGEQTSHFMKVYKNLNASSHTVTCQFSEAHASNLGDVLNYTLFALNLSKFKTVNAVHVNSNSNVTSGEQLHTNVDLTPTVTGDYFFFWSITGQNIIDMSPAESGNNIKFKINGTDYTPGTALEGTEDDDRAINGFPQYVDMGMVNLASGGNVDLDCYTDFEDSNVDHEQHSAVAFSMELVDPVRFISGTITEKGQKVARKVLVYRRGGDNELLGSTTSGSDGKYTVTGLPNVECMVVAQDDDAGEDFNAVILSRIIPEV